MPVLAVATFSAFYSGIAHSSEKDVSARVLFYQNRDVLLSIKEHLAQIRFLQREIKEILLYNFTTVYSCVKGRIASSSSEAAGKSRHRGSE
jgi:hypothetical protein